MIEFSTFCKNKKTSDIKIDNSIVTYKRYSDDLAEVPFMFEPTIENVHEFLKSRCMPEKRTTQIEEYLKTLDLETFDVMEILKKTHGVMWEDFMWIKFPEDNLEWEDVKIRG